ncbi:MAG: hypothetical protein A3E78_07405 [Alphaproteobacteria bacterium RIFCSPHIGHO2_12_FULL_63_12]|nr:MAG: hypothetical protein A3E78_07405 [Alphaproteobacteria bacterium RIFCSPHIGHO2_12_FULL_63_12]
MTTPNWSAIAATLTTVAPVAVESEPNGGRKLCIVSVGSGRLLAKVPGDTAMDRAIAEALAASVNVTARASSQEAA